MIIILEGPDGGGKSTIAEALRQSVYPRTPSGMATHMVHHGPYPGIQKGLALRYLASLRRRHHDNQKTVVIMDRSWLSEPVYGAALRGGQDRIGVAQRRMLERIALKCGAMVVLCRPPWEVVKTTWERRKGVELVKEERWLREVYDGYAKVRSDLDVLDYDYTQPVAPKEQLFTYVMQRLGTYRPPAAGIGQWGVQSTLLVTDHVNALGSDMPFVSFHEGGCSAWLARKLEEWRVPECNLYWVNASQLAPDFMGRDDAPKKVVALGKVGAAWCMKAGLEFTEVEHPYYWKQSHHNDEYVSLKEALSHAVV